MAEEEEWREQHDRVKMDKRDARVDDLLVATCGEDGEMHVWRPLQVSRRKQFLARNSFWCVVRCGQRNGHAICNVSVL